MPLSGCAGGDLIAVSRFMADTDNKDRRATSERPLSARLAHCPASSGRSLDCIDSGRSTVVAGTRPDALTGCGKSHDLEKTVMKWAQQRNFDTLCLASFADQPYITNYRIYDDR